MSCIVTSRSGYIIEIHHKLEFFPSYSQVSRFEKKKTAVFGSFTFLNISENTTLLLAADNVDHNICTLDRKDIFHGLGVIAAVTLKNNICPIARRCDIVEIGVEKLLNIDITKYTYAKDIMKNILEIYSAANGLTK